MNIVKYICLCALCVAIATVSEAAGREPPDARSAIAAYQGAEFPKAEQLLTTTIKKYPNNDVLYFTRGMTRLELKKYKEALEDFDATLELVPTDAKALYNRSFALYKLDRLSEALESAELAREYFHQLEKEKETKQIDEFIKYLREKKP